MTLGASEHEYRHVPGSRGELLLAWFHAARGTPGSGRSILYLPPFGEEANKSRRLVAEQSRALAAAGCDVFLLDPWGCGDSGGELHDARWSMWLEDVGRTVAWLEGLGRRPGVLWGLRLGASLAAEWAARERGSVRDLLLWHPLVDGAALLRSFLRLRVASEALRPAGSQGVSVGSLEKRLESGESLEVAGYEMTPELAADLRGVRLDLRPGVAERVHWLEIVPSPDSDLSPTSRRAISAAVDAGVSVDVRRITTAPFWATHEIMVSPELIEATCRALRTQYG